jgi:hypothetical protein
MNDLRRTPAGHEARPWKQRLQAECFSGRDGGVVVSCWVQGRGGGAGVTAQAV